jgi:biotin carboxyl carrier protein
VLDDRMIEVLVTEESQAFNVQIAGRTYDVETVRRRGRGRESEGDQFVDGRWLLRAPLTGVVVETRVAAGDAVAQGDVLLVVEAMKMLNELRTRVAGTVSAVHPEAGQRVELGRVLVEISEPS